MTNRSDRSLSVAQLGEQLEDRRLHRDVERRGDLVAEHQLRGRRGRRGRSPPAGAGRRSVRRPPLEQVGVRRTLRSISATTSSRSPRATSGRNSFSGRSRLADRVARVERRVRVLEDDLDRLARLGRPLRRRGGQRRAAVGRPCPRPGGRGRRSPAAASTCRCRSRRRSRARRRRGPSPRRRRRPRGGGSVGGTRSAGPDLEDRLRLSPLLAPPASRRVGVAAAAAPRAGMRPAGGAHAADAPLLGDAR